MSNPTTIYVSAHHTLEQLQNEIRLFDAGVRDNPRTAYMLIRILSKMIEDLHKGFVDEEDGVTDRETYISLGLIPESTHVLVHPDDSAFISSRLPTDKGIICTVTEAVPAGTLIIVQDTTVKHYAINVALSRSE